MRVLVSEDDPVSRRLLEAMLVKWGYDVAVVKDGAEAWEKLQREDTPRLVILDWMMPGIDGVQVCRMVRKRGDERYVYILILTAKSRKQDIVEGMNAGADDYIVKPFDPDELKARLRAGKRILDLQAELIAIREALRQQATHDSLTGLPNRLLFSDRLTQQLAQAKRDDRSLAVLFLDLDRFKNINDTLGHAVGDQLLQKVVERLTRILREVDTVARMGGDEFTIILSDIPSVQGVASIARKVIDVMAEPFALDGREVFVTASIGIGISPSDGADVETLVRNADIAMYRAKERGGNTFQLYTEAFNTLTMERMTLEHGLRMACERGEFVVYYQPRVDIKTDTTLGAEALVRWKHPEIGLVFPDDFIPLAEETGLIVPISEFVLRAACAQNVEWQKAGTPPIDIAVNISARQFQHSDLAEVVERILDETGMDARYLDLELTETTLMRNPDNAVTVLNKLRSTGVRISIDDFGTGYSSLSYLKKFPINTVKIDRSFIRNIVSDPDDAAIAGAMVAMAHGLKLKVVAEGVETLEQLQFLKSLNCDEMQGYFVSRPVPAEEFAQLLLMNNMRKAA